MSMMIIPDVVGEQEVKTLRPEQSARDAARLMSRFDISAVIVVDDAGQLAGIVTERDLSRRVVDPDLRGSEVALADIMTPNPAWLRPEDNALRAMDTMRNLRIRHLPVVEEGQVVGIVSIRDLRNVLQYMVVMAEGPQLTVADLPRDLRGQELQESGPPSGEGLAGRAMQDIEREAIKATLELTAGNRKAAADMLQIGERTLYRKIEKYGL